jgi:heme A synthase
MNHTVINTINFQFHKLAASLGFIAVLAAIIIAWNTPAINYESSIYLSTPLITWVLLLIGFGLGVWIVLSKTG